MLRRSLEGPKCEDSNFYKTCLFGPCSFVLAHRSSLAVLIRFDGDLVNIEFFENLLYSSLGTSINFAVLATLALGGKLRNFGNWGYLFCLRNQFLVD